MIKARPCAGDVAAGEDVPAGSSRPSSGANISTSRAVADVHAMKRQIHAYRGPRRDRGRRPQHQARPRRHPRDRVLRADAAADRRRPPSGAARPRDAADARRRSPRAAGSAPRRARDLDGGLSLPARDRAPPADGRRRADPHAAGRREGARAVRALSRLRRTATRSPRRCSAICARCSAITRGCSRTRRGRSRRAARSRFPPDSDDRETLDRLAAMGFRAPLEVSATVRSWLVRRLPLAAQRVRARAARRSRAGAARPSGARRKIPTPRSSAFDRFLAGLHGGARLFSLLRQNPGPGGAAGADARHRAAARRHSGAASRR